jgi:signal transduction histidine kinase
LEVDEARLEEVMHNLLDNATKYSPENSRITIRAARESENTITISVGDERHRHRCR